MTERIAEILETAGGTQAGVDFTGGKRIGESSFWLDMGLQGSIYNPFDELFDPVSGETWLPLFSGSYAYSRSVILATEAGLEIARMICRYMATENEFANNALENRINYIVGEGMTFKVGSNTLLAETDALDKDTLDKLHRLMCWWMENESFPQMQEEIVMRSDRDGEAILRAFKPEGAPMTFRFIEPGQVKAPPGRADITFGIQSVEGDACTPLYYYIDGEPVPAEEVFHIKFNTDQNVKRGVPTLWAIRRNLHRATKLLKNMSILAQYQSSVLAVRTHEVGDASSVRNFADNRASFNVTDPFNQKSQRVDRIAANKIIDTSSKIKYEFPAIGVNAANLVEILRAELRAAAARLVMTESMFTSDAGNQNYASSIVAEGPTHKMFKRMQARVGVFFVKILTAVLTDLIVRNNGPQELIGAFKIDFTGPEVASRDQKKNAESNAILHSNGILSKRTWANESNLDYDREVANMEDEPDPPSANPNAGDPDEDGDGTSDGNSSGNDGGKGGKGKDKGGSKDPKEKEKTQGAPKP